MFIRHVQKSTFLLIAILLLICPVHANAIPAFPGAEGMGASTVGGRGGTVYKVTNLNDSGTGSFRAACEASGPRIVVFEVSGIINLETSIIILNPYITIAGQTSPGGILVARKPFVIQGTHDVIVTHMRFRMGSHGCSGGECETEGDAVLVMGVAGSAAYNVIFDHCSMSWGTDETVDIGSWYGDTYNVTLSWCSIAEGLQDPHPESNHGYGVLVTGKYIDSRPIDVTMHHCFLSHFQDRLPQLVFNVFGDVRNNVIYDWNGSLSLQMQNIAGSPSYANFVHNYAKQGPNSNSVENGSRECFFCGTVGNCHVAEGEEYEAIYCVGNLGVTRDDQGDPEWCVTEGWGPPSLLSTDFQRSTAFTTSDIPVTTTTMSTIYVDSILDSVGATKPLRDSIDIRLVNEYYTGTGDIPADKTYPDDWPTFSTPPAPTDNDSDGMADSWELAQGLNIAVDDSALDQDSDGYTNIEEYLHYLSNGEEPLKGDLTGDSIINIQDIQACVNHILGTQDWGDAADVNGDEAVNVLDVQAIVNIILGA